VEATAAPERPFCCEIARRDLYPYRNFVEMLMSLVYRQILRLSRRTTVLPIIGRADILTTAQREAIKHVVWRDLLAGGLADNFSILEHLCHTPAKSAEERSPNLEHHRQGQQDIEFDGDPLQPPSDFDWELLSTCMPLFCTNPERELYASGEKGNIPRIETPSFVRQCIWGDMDILAPEFGDTGRLYSGLLSKAFASVSERM